MTPHPLLTDRAALDLHRRRIAANPVLFAHEHAADNIQERLIEVNRPFTNPAVVTGLGTVWTDRIPGAALIDDTDTLNLAPVSHDLVVHALSLHWANDPVGQLVQCRRALRPDGLLIAATFGGQTLHELRSVLAEAEIATKGGLSPRVAPMGEIRDWGALLQRAGFALPVADSYSLTVSYRDIWALMRDLRGMGETNALTDRIRHATNRRIFEKANDLYRAHFGGQDDRILATFEIVVLTGWAPAPDQQKPLRPGSAQQRLADILGATEVPLRPE
jgi:SAM-dependent methyltransferase